MTDDTNRAAPDETPRHQVQAVFERLEEGLEDALFAVLLVGEAEDELILPAHRLPRGAQEGAWLRLLMDGERVVAIELDAEETAARRSRIQAKRAALKSRPRRFTPREG